MRRYLFSFPFFFVACMLSLWLASRGFILGGPVLESGDYAANALQIDRAKIFQELLGNYSRWHFNHTGPAFFYVYAFSENIFFDWLKFVASPHQAHVLGGMLLQSIFVASACTIIYRATKRFTGSLAFFAAVLLVMALVNVGGMNSIWPPHVLFGPFLLMCVASAYAFLGSTKSLYMLVIAACFCVHGHVAQPLLVIPITALGGFGWFQRSRSAGLTYTGIAVKIIPCVVVILIFLLPILLDLLINRPSNLHKILAYAHAEHGATPSLKDAVVYVMGYWLFLPHPENGVDGSLAIAMCYVGVFLSAVICLGAIRPGAFVFHQSADRDSLSFQRMLSVISLISIALSIIWGTRITGPLYEFNAFYVYALVAVSVYIGLEIFADFAAWLGLKRPGVLVAIVSVLVIGVACSRQNPPFSAEETFLRPHPVIGDQLAGKAVAIDFPIHSQWPQATALMLDVVRSGGVTRINKDWGFMMGEYRVFRAGTEQFPANGLVISLNPKTSVEKKQPFPSDMLCSPALTGVTLGGGDREETFGELLRTCRMSSFGASFPDGDFVYTLDDGALFQYRLPDGAAHISLLVEPFSVAARPNQRLSISINGEKLFDDRISGEQRITLPVHCTVCTVQVVTPDAFSPSSVGAGQDQRILGFMMKSISYH